MKIVGLDLSINGSGCVSLTLDDNLDIIDKDFRTFTTVKKNATDKIIHYNKKKDFDDYIEQNIWMTKQIINFCSLGQYVAIEDYAYGAMGAVFHIGEFCGYVKHCLYEQEYIMRLYEPTTVKKFIIRGNADKILIEEEYDKLPKKEKFAEIEDLPRGGKSPRCDVIDAYNLAKLLQLELKVRAGIITVRDLTDKQREIFNKVSKKNPENLLVRPFLGEAVC